MTATLIRFPIEKAMRRGSIDAEATILPLPKRKDEVALLCEASFEAMQLSWKMLLAGIDGSWT
jgi:hypothetical protein